MSSMFKKKGGLAFKPKAPPLRRAGASTTSPSVAPAAARLSKTPAPSQPASTAPHPPPPPPPPPTQPAPKQAQYVAPTPPPSAPTEIGAAPPPIATRTRRSSHAAETAATVRPNSTAPVTERAVVQEASTVTATPSPTQARTRTRRASTAASVTADQHEKEAGGPPDETQTQVDEDTTRSRITISHLLQTEGRAAAAPAITAAEPPARRTRSVAAARSQQPGKDAGTTSALGAGQAGIGSSGSAAPAVGRPEGAAVAATAPTRTPAAEPAPRATTGRRGRPRAAPEQTVSTNPDTATLESEPTAAFTIAAEDGTASTAPKKRKYTRKKPAGEAAADEQEDGTAAQPRKSVSRKRSATEADAADGPVGDGIAAAASPTPAPASSSAPKRSRKERSVTPEDAETRTVDHRELKMEDLTKDLRIGKKFSRHDELVDRLREKRRQYRRERLLSKKKQDGTLSTNNSSRDGSVLDGETGEPSSSSLPAQGDAAAASAAGSTPTATATKIKSAPAMAGPQFEIIDGAIVVNQASLVHDRHAAAAAEAGELEEVEENDFTRQTTSNTYLKPGKLRGPNAWTEAETELFYRALSMFGTSFDLICKWFPGKSRRHIKMKFNREDKLRPERITQSLVGQHKVAIDVDEYMARTGQTLHATETIDAEYALRQAEHDAEQQRIVDEQAETLRMKREELFGPRNGGNVGSTGGVGGAGGTGANGPLKDEVAGGGTGGNGDDDEIDETDAVAAGGKGAAGSRRNGRAGRGGRGAGRYGGRNGAGASRPAVAGGFGI